MKSRLVEAPTCRSIGSSKTLRKKPYSVGLSSKRPLVSKLCSGYASVAVIGQAEGSKILCSGFWGLARHINYFGEIVQAIALALPGW